MANARTELARDRPPSKTSRSARQRAAVRQLAPAALLIAMMLGPGGCGSVSQAQTSATPIPDDQLAALVSEGRQAIVDCLRERGWDVTLEVDGWSMEGAGPDQSEAYARDQSEC